MNLSFLPPGLGKIVGQTVKTSPGEGKLNSKPAVLGLKTDLVLHPAHNEGVGEKQTNWLFYK